MPSACCCSGCPHHLTVWGQGGPHPPPPSIPQGWAIPGMGTFLSLSPEAPIVLSLSQQALSSEKGTCV